MSEHHNNRQPRFRSNAPHPNQGSEEGWQESFSKPHKMRLEPRPGSPREQWEQRRLSQRIGYKPEENRTPPAPNPRAQNARRAPSPGEPKKQPGLSNLKTTPEIGQDNLRSQAQKHGHHNPRLAKNKQGLPAPTPKAPFKISPLLLILAAILVIGVTFSFFLGNRSFNVTVNGVEVTLKGEHTLTSLVKDGYANPQPGNMLAVDGLPIEGHDGLPFSAVVNGKPVEDLDQRVRGGQVIIISDGGDMLEPYDETTETVAFTITEEGNGPLHVFEGEGADGRTQVRTGSVSGISVRLDEAPVTNVVCRSGFPNVGEEKVVALTFEGGPSPETTVKVLDLLASYNMKATFFIEGDEFNREQEELIKRIANSGHQVAVKTPAEVSENFDSLSVDDQRNELMKGYDALCRISGHELSRVYRSADTNNPHGQRQLASYMRAEIGWTIDSKDKESSSMNTIVLSIEAANSGSIVLLHDGGGNGNQMVEALGIALPYLKELGFRFVTVDELL